MTGNNVIKEIDNSLLNIKQVQKKLISIRELILEMAILKENDPTFLLKKNELKKLKEQIEMMGIVNNNMIYNGN